MKMGVKAGDRHLLLLYEHLVAAVPLMLLIIHGALHGVSVLQWTSLLLCSIYFVVCLYKTCSANAKNESNASNVTHTYGNNTVDDNDRSSHFPGILLTKGDDISWRLASTQGEWCVLLIPLVVITDSMYCPSNYDETKLWSMNLLLLFHILKSAESAYVLQCLAALHSWQCFYITQTVPLVDFWIVLVIFLIMASLQNILPYFLKYSFTRGESAIISTGIGIYLLSITMNMRKYSIRMNTIAGLYLEQQQLFFFTGFALIGGAVVIITCYTLRNRIRKTPVIFYPILFSFIAGITILLSLTLQTNPLRWLFGYIIGVKQRHRLFIFWASGSGISAAIVMICYFFLSDPGATTMRKYFHILATVIFTPGILIDPVMLSTAMSCALVVFAILECIRILRIWPFGQAIHNAFQFFLDEQDGGQVIMTHQYLLVGCAAPLWLNPQQGQGQIPSALVLLSGVTSIGIGDTAASIVGSRYGTHKWTGSFKSKEGTLASIISQFVFIIATTTLLILWQYVTLDESVDVDLSHVTSLAVDAWIQNYSTGFIRCSLLILGLVTTSLLEAFTGQIDNLVLPLYAYCMFRMV